MSGFSAEWLALREPADAAARAVDVTAFALDAVADRSPLRVVDLGAGTGSNVRYLSPRIPVPQKWRLVDHDPALLATAQRAMPFSVDTLVADLRVVPSVVFELCDVVSASALLDLVSAAWLRQVVERCVASRMTVLFALNYDGRIDCNPHDADDEFVRDLVNRHQRTDKGFGPALGPDAGVRAEDVLRSAGYEVRRAASDWALGPDQSQLQRELVAGWAGAAAELSPTDADRIDAWMRRRLSHVDAGRSTIVVGHDDVAGVFR
jgi:SAM-dependent methyltransferase